MFCEGGMVHYASSKIGDKAFIHKWYFKGFCFRLVLENDLKNESMQKIKNLFRKLVNETITQSEFDASVEKELQN